MSIGGQGEWGYELCRSLLPVAPTGLQASSRGGWEVGGAEKGGSLDSPCPSDSKVKSRAQGRTRARWLAAGRAVSAVPPLHVTEAKWIPLHFTACAESLKLQLNQASSRYCTGAGEVPVPTFSEET